MVTVIIKTVTRHECYGLTLYFRQVNNNPFHTDL